MSSEQHAGLHWFKSSHSSGEGGACVEVATNFGTVHIRDTKNRSGPQLAFTPTAWTGFITDQAIPLHWFKSSHSGGDGGECVEVATNTGAVHVRDSKERGGPQLTFTPAAWAGFVADVGRRRSW